MTFAGVLTTKRVALGCLCAGALAAGACAEGSGVPTRPSAGGSAPALAASSPRTGDIYVTKECSQNAGLAGQFWTITSSNVDAIEVNQTSDGAPFLIAAATTRFLASPTRPRYDADSRHNALG